jgi:hypothetical protein
VHSEDFFEAPAPSGALDLEISHFKRNVAEAVLAGEILGTSDLEVADVVVNLVHVELEGYGTDGKNRLRGDRDVELLIRSARMACKRVVGWEIPLALPICWTTKAGCRRWPELHGPACRTNSSWGVGLGRRRLIAHRAEKAPR